MVKLSRDTWGHREGGVNKSVLLMIDTKKNKKNGLGEGWVSISIRDGNRDGDLFREGVTLVSVQCEETRGDDDLLMAFFFSFSLSDITITIFCGPCHTTGTTIQQTADTGYPHQRVATKLTLVQMRVIPIFLSVLTWTTLDAVAAKSPPPTAAIRPLASVPTTNLRQRLFKVRDILKKKDDNVAKSSLSEGSLLSSPELSALAGVGLLIAYQKVVAEAFKATNVKFPAMLGACMSLFAILLGLEAISPSVSDSIFQGLTPGAGLLAKWLPMFFVPALTLLPLSPPIGSATEVAKVFLTVVVGWVFSLITTGFCVLGFRRAQGAVSEGSTIKPPVSTGKPFRQETLSFFTVAFCITGAISIFATRSGFEYAQPLQTVFMTCFTIALYVFAARLPAGFVKLVHPLVTTSAGLLSMVHGLALATNQDYKDILRSYKVGSLSPLKTGSGDIMLYALGPSVVSFATAMYGRRALLKANFLVVATGVLVGSLGSLYGTAAFVRLISLGSQMIRLSMVPRSVTTALAMVLASMLGGDVSIAAAVVSLTGIIGATFARTVLDYLKISDPVTRGLAVGASSQGLGVASIAGEPDAFPFAAMAMVLCAIVSTTLVSFPMVKDSILKIAGGV